MLRRKALLVALCLWATGCTGPAPPVDTAQLPPGALGSNEDPDTAAINLAQSAFADPARTYGKPVEAARAAAAMDYLAGEMSTNPRWGNVGPDTKAELLQGREDVRKALGVVPGTPSQVVVDRLVAAANALAAGDRATAVRLLGPPAFNAPGAEVIGRLSNMPYMRAASASTQQAANAMFPPDTPGLNLGNGNNLGPIPFTSWP